VNIRKPRKSHQEKFNQAKYNSMPRLRNKFRRQIYLTFVTIIILTTCSTLSPVSAGVILPLIFPEVEAVQPQWQHYAEGMDYFHGKITNPRLEFYALRIDLDAPGVGIVVRAGAQDANGASSVKVSSFVRGNNLAAGINTVPFNINTTAEGQPIQNIGIVISDGVTLSPANRRYDALVFYKKENPEAVRAAVVRQSSIQDSAEYIENAVGGFHQILVNGMIAQNSETRHPRSAAGISQDGRFLVLLVVDGRRTASAGSTEEETAAILKALGSHNGINFDGGGSSALAMRYPDGNVSVVNTPVHGMIPGQERAVAGCLGISLR